MANNCIGYAISVAGTPLVPLQMSRIASLQVTRKVDDFATAQLVVRVWDTTTNGIDQAAIDLFAMGSAIAFSFGYGSDLTAVFSGEIEEVALTFAIPATLTVSCRCLGTKLRRSLQATITSGSDYQATEVDLMTAAEALVSKVGLTPKFTSFTEKRAHIIIAGINAWQFLLEAAKELQCQLYVDGTNVVIQPPQTSGAAAAAYTWGADLLALDMRFDVRTAATSITATGLAADGTTALAETITPKDVLDPQAKRVAALLDKVELEATAVRQLPTSSDLQDSASLRLSAIAEMERMLLGCISGTATISGDPLRVIDTLVELKNAGPFTGLQYVSQVQHRIGSDGFTTIMTFGRPTKIMPPDGKAKQSGGGLLARSAPALRGVVRATVVTNVDPQKRGWVQVKLPWLGEELAPIWAAVAAPGAGKSRGLLQIPEAGDEVLLAFVGDDQGDPVVLAGLWSDTNTIPTAYDAEANNRRVLISRSGHQFLLDDTDQKQSISIISQAEQKIIIDDTSGSEKISLTDKTGNSLVMDANGITLTAAAGKKIVLTSGSGDIDLSGMNVAVKAQQGFTADGLQCEVKATAALSLSGATAELKGSAMATISAGLVKIN